MTTSDAGHTDRTIPNLAARTRGNAYRQPISWPAGQPYPPAISQPGPAWQQQAGSRGPATTPMLPVPAQADPVARDEFAQAVDRYNSDRAAAFADYRAAADDAWRAYLWAMGAASGKYDRAVSDAGARYDSAVSSHASRTA